MKEHAKRNANVEGAKDRTIKEKAREITNECRQFANTLKDMHIGHFLQERMTETNCKTFRATIIRQQQKPFMLLEDNSSCNFYFRCTGTLQRL